MSVPIRMSHTSDDVAPPAGMRSDGAVTALRVSCVLACRPFHLGAAATKRIRQMFPLSLSARYADRWIARYLARGRPDDVLNPITEASDNEPEELWSPL